MSFLIAFDLDLRSVSEQDFMWNGSKGGASGWKGGIGLPVSGSNCEGGKTISPKISFEISHLI